MYVYRTKGICPAEIHFEISGNKLCAVRFVGGGCRGNASLISRLLERQELEAVLPLMKGISCRNDTSCPDQLFRAVEMARCGELGEADPIRVFEDLRPHGRLAVIAGLNGNLAALRAVLSRNPGAVYCLGSLTGPRGENDAVAELARKEKVIFARGPFDNPDSCEKPENKDLLLLAPHYLVFKLGYRLGLGFYGGYIQEVNGFSDFSPYSLELLMVSNLSDYLRNEEVYPALQTMTEQFAADLVLFAHTGLYRQVRLGRVDFVNIGPVVDGGKYRYAQLEWDNNHLNVTFQKVDAV
ncbi:MAG: TIGR03905 family TSCPD domain-containing protein [Bacillota bacterium]